MDGEMTIGDLISLFAALAATGAAIAAVIIGIYDRRNARQIAVEDRRAAARQARLVFEWEAAKRLAIIEARGGHTDRVISKDMGAESLALTGLLGRDRVPNMWDRRVGKSDEELRAFIEDETNEEYLRDAVEAERAMKMIADEIRELDRD